MHDSRLGHGSAKVRSADLSGRDLDPRNGGDFVEVFLRATGFEPYDYQRRVAEEGLPELLQVQTGCGKTEAVGLGWLYRRLFHPDSAVRDATPHWLVVALPTRTLVEQTVDRFKLWIQKLGLSGDVALHIVQGGIGWSDRDWRLEPDRDAVFVGTIDMLLSRALNRGYADNRYQWPMSFGGFNNGVHWVFDEIQLMDVATPNTRQLQSFRDTFGTALPTSSTWMSATVDDRLLMTVDRPEVGNRVQLDELDLRGALRSRLDAVRTVSEVDLPDSKRERALANALLEHHQPATLTLAVLNTVDRAVATWESLKKLNPDVEVVLLHSRFRPVDRAKHTEAALSEPGSAGKVIVSTQVLEAGIDLSAALLFTEAAPWPSIVQRAGRCNRDGHREDARLLWAPPPTSPPYEEADVAASVESLRSLAGRAVTTTQLQNRDVPVSDRITPVIRRKDLIDLFDTTPDLSGNDIDVARFIRDQSDRTVQVAWRQTTDNSPSGTSPNRAELCSVTISEIRKRLKKHSVWKLDHLSRDSDKPWVRCTGDDLHDGVEVVLDASKGGYDPEIGWDPNSKDPVHVIEVPATRGMSTDEIAIGDEPASHSIAWYSLAQHLIDVEHACEELLDGFGTSCDFTSEMRRAAVIAGRLHDIGKASPVWQKAMLATADVEQRASLEDGGPYAKTDNNKRPRFIDPTTQQPRRYFRHELASALALMSEGASSLGDPHETDLVIYLVAAHHGRIRLSIRRHPEESDLDDEAVTILGVAEGDVLPELDLGGSTVPRSYLKFPTGDDKYERRALALRDRPDLGPFRLAFLELVVRSADWRASRDIGADK